jgi:outer membrane protein OmpA-like peptidoglycan-associated protein
MKSRRPSKDFSYFNSVRGYDRGTSMKPRFGVCKNKVGCSFAYTGEKIPVPADSKCPECGQPLAVDSSKQGGAKILILIGLLLLLLLIGGGVALFSFKDQIFHLAFNKPDTKQKPTEGQGDDKIVNASPSDNQDASAPAPSSANSASTPDSSLTPEAKVVVAPGETPLPPPPPDAEQEKRKPVVEPASTPGVQTDNPSPTQNAPRRDSEATSAGTGGVIQPAATLTKTEVDATREDVLKRINAMPRFTAEEKKRLSEKMETARSMERLLVIRFDTGQTALSRAASDDLMKRFKSKEVQDKVSDPTVVFVVAGYADAAGDPKTNLQISQQRADNVSKVLKDKTNLLNVIHSVGMGSTDLLDGKRPDQNRAVEVWAVAP